MKILFATTNPAKIKKYESALKEHDVELITIKDLDFEVEVEENGKNAIENAYIKAKAYYDATGIISIGMDNNLFIEGIPEEKQPGTHVRRVNGKTLTDDEMIEYYTNLVKEYGDKLVAKWVYGMVIYDGKNVKELSWSKSNFYFVDKPCEKRNPGYPLDSIAIVPEYNKYLVELTEDEKKTNSRDNKDNEVVNFIINNI
jgi:8-oxo-dGTP diphosphatase